MYFGPKACKMFIIYVNPYLDIAVCDVFAKSEKKKLIEFKMGS